ncbi:hypothetical protein [Streptomyces sp. NBC_01497]|nr:hypothetical protein [Streptomyces sp. NBC_01497]
MGEPVHERPGIVGAIGLHPDVERVPDLRDDRVVTTLDGKCPHHGW